MVLFLSSSSGPGDCYLLVVLSAEQAVRCHFSLSSVTNLLWGGSLPL